MRETLEIVERDFGYPLPSLHRLYLEVGNGGFGLGYGICSQRQTSRQDRHAIKGIDHQREYPAET